MPKRKRPQNEAEFVGRLLLPGQALDTQGNQVEQQIAIGKRALSRALKLARGFERQKLGRRLKLARAEGDLAGIVRLNAEVEGLKVLNLPNLAEDHIYKTLVKLKAISHSPGFSQRFSTTGKTSRTGKTEQGTAVSNVTARLYNSNPVKATMADILKAVRIALGLEDVCRGEDQKAQKRRKGNKARAFSPEHFISNSELEAGVVSSTVGSEVEGGNRPSGKTTETRPKYGQGDASILGYDSRIAGNESKEYSFSCDREDSGEMPQGHDDLLKAYSPEVDQSLSSPVPKIPSLDSPPIKSQKQKKPPISPESTFLPSLMGGYWSGSESAEDKPADLQPRKNRMGQRARRQLWEKKFGMKANHLKEALRDEDWDPKKGAKANSGRGGSRPARESFHVIDTATKDRRTEGKQGRGRSSSKPRSSVKRVDEGPLHPSWEAAKKAKQQATQTAFKGKKIVFD